MISVTKALLRAPRLAAAVVLMFGLGIAATTIMYSVVKGVLLTAVAIPEPDAVIVLHRQNNADEADVGYPDIVDLRSRSEAISSFAPIWPGHTFDLIGDAEPVRVAGSLVDAGWFEVAALRPLIGRTLQPSDDVAGAPAVAVISESAWRNRFAADPGIVGTTVTLSGVPTTIVGVVPGEADLLNLGTEIWAPFIPWASWVPESRGSNNLEVVARLADGASIATAVTELDGLTSALALEYPDTNRGKILTALPVVEFVTAGVRTQLVTILAAAAMLLLISIANAAGLLLVRALRRDREMAVRSAIGASRGRLVTLLLGEGMALGIVGGALGITLAFIGFDLLQAFLLTELPRGDLIALDGPAVSFAVAVSIIAGVGASLVPMWRISRSDTALRGARSLGAGRTRALGWFAAGELALALVLLVGTAMMLRSMWNLNNLPLGFEPTGVLSAQLVLPAAGYSDKDPQTQAITSVVDRLAEAPGIVSAAYIAGAPMGGSTIGHPLVIEGVEAPEGQSFGTRIRPVYGDYFGAMGVSLVQGRLIAATDTASSERVAVVNREFAREFFGDDNPVGQRIAWRPGASTPAELGPQWMTIVGVVDDVRSIGLREGEEVAVYYPFTQRDQTWIRFGELVVQVEGDPSAYVRTVQEAVWTVDPTVPLGRTMPMTAMVARDAAPTRILATLIAGFGLVALVLALQGLFVVIAYTVRQLEPEVALRVALGASRHAAVRFVMGGGFRAIAVGIAVGLGLSLAAGRLLEAQLVGLTPTDPIVFSVVIAALAVCAALATWLPARRAARIDPMVALREE